MKQRITKVKYDWVKFYYVSNRGAQIVRIQVDDSDITFINADLENYNFQYKLKGINDIIENAFQIPSVGKQKYYKITKSDYIVFFILFIVFIRIIEFQFTNLERLLK